MKYYFVIFSFDNYLEGGQTTAEEDLMNHPQIVNYFKEREAVKLSPTTFLLASNNTTTEIFNSLTPFIDRAETLIVFEVTVESWEVFSNSDFVGGLTMMFNKPEEKKFS